MTQQEQLLKRLRQDWTTPLDALMYCGCMRLAARILECKQAGMNVVDKWVDSNGKKYKAYKII